jgi:hypothetical protein
MPDGTPPMRVLEEAVSIAFEKLEQYGVIDVDHNYESAGEEEPMYGTSEKFNGHFLEGLANSLKKGLPFNEDRYYELVVMSILKAAGGEVQMGSEPVMCAAVMIVMGALDDETEPVHRNNYHEKAVDLMRRMDATGKYSEGINMDVPKQADLEDF